MGATTDLPNSVAATLKMVSISFRLLATLSVTTYECVISFSSLRHINTRPQNTMENNRLNGIVLQYIHREINLPIDEIMIGL